MSKDTIYREDAILAMANALWHYPNDCYKNLNVYEFAKALAELGLRSLPSAQPEITLESAIDYLHSIGWMQDHDKQMYEMGMADANVQPVQWIPCSERLPEKKEEHYWVCLDSGGQCQCRWTNDRFGLGANEWNEWGWSIMDKPMYTKIVAWMPLPEPYRKDGEADG